VGADILMVVNVHVMVFWMWRSLVWRLNTNVSQNLLPPHEWYSEILAPLVHYAFDGKNAFTFIKVRICQEFRAIQVNRCSRWKRSN
jgi:hypothetical protein